VCFVGDFTDGKLNFELAFVGTYLYLNVKSRLLIFEANKLAAAEF
jgi:hypothetical protein